MSEPRYPEITVQLVDLDGNAMAIISRVQRALNEAGKREAGTRFVNAALDAPSYDYLLRLVRATVTVA